MATRGRKSAAALAVVTALPGQRPEPPAELTDEQAAEWRAIVGRMPADWFTRETQPLLVQYCRHVVKARLVAQAINDFDPAWLADEDGLKRYDKLTQIAEREGRAMSSLATRMRITQQSRYNAAAANTASTKAAKGDKPWQRQA